MLNEYLKRAYNLPSRSAGGQAEFAGGIGKGDRKALTKLVRSNQEFVMQVARQFRGQGMPFRDLVAKGNVGLIKAAERFDHTKGYNFSSYAVLWIRQAITMALAEQFQNRQQRR